MASAKIIKQSDKLEEKIAQLASYSTSQLRLKWRDLYRRDPPRSFGPDLLRRSIAFRIQEDAYGGLNAETRRTLDLLVRKLRDSPKDAVELPRRIKAGSELIRTWKGSRHRVIVGEQGYIYDGHAYKTLSKIARKITGTRWNGPRFFGLRNPNAEDTLKQKTRSVR